MRKLLTGLLLILGCAGTAFAQRSVIVTGTVRDTNGSLYVNGTGRASIIPPTGVQQPVVTIVSLGANATFSIQVADTSQVQPVNTALWQFSFCSQGYVNQNGQTSQYCFTMTPMAVVGPGPVDISTQIQAQATILPTVIGGAFTAGGDLSGTNVNQTVSAIQGHGVSGGSPAAGDFFRYNGTTWLTTLLTGSDIPNNAASTTGNAATATAFQVAPTGCTPPNFSVGVNASGNSTCAQPSDTTGNAATASALFSTPTLCSTNNAPLGILPSGNATGCFSVNMFSALLPGTNVNGALHIGTGSSLDATGGTIVATSALATAGTPTKCISSQAATGINSDFSAAGCFTPGGGPPGGATFDVQVNNAGNLGSGVTNQANVGVVGNIAVKVAATNAIEYAASGGNDSNDGKSWGTAKLTVMAAYDALPTQGGTIYICSIYTNAINWTTGGQGAWIAGPNDPNYASLPTGWRKLKSAKFIGSCPDTGGYNEPINYVNMNSALGPMIWISSTTGQAARLDFENLLLQYATTYNVELGVDSNSAQTTNSGAWAVSFNNITTNVAQQAGAGPGWLIGGGDTFNIKMDRIMASGNGTATPGSDAQAAILFKPTGGSNRSANGIITNSLVTNGGIKYYEGNLSGTMTVKDTYSESINGTGVTPGVGTFWAASPNTASITKYSIEKVFTADSIGSVCDARFDVYAWHQGDISVQGGTYVCSGQAIQQGSIVGGNLGNRTGGSDPLVNGASGVSYGRYYGFLGNTQRQLAPSAVRYANIAPSTSSSWSVSGSGASIATGITAPDGTTGAARVTTTTNTGTIAFSSQSLPLTAGQYFVAGVYERFNTADNYYSFSGSNTFGLGITVGGAGNTVTCSLLWPPGISTDAWFWVYQLCQVTAAPTSPATVTMTSAAPVVGAHVSVMDFYAPILLNIPAGSISNDEVYELANSLVPYNSACAVGTLCGIGGTWQAPNVIISSVTPGTSPICPNGVNGTLTTSGCAGGGGSSIIVNGGSPVASPANFQNGAASLGDTFNMVQAGSNISPQLAAGSVRTVPGGGTGANTFTAHGPLIGEGTAAVVAGNPGLAGQCWLSGGAGSDPAFSNCPTGFTNPMTTVGDLIYGGGGGSATRLGGPTTPNGVPETLIEIPSGGAANPPQYQLTGVPVNAQTGAGYTVGLGDRASLITLSNAAPQNLTMVDPATAGFGFSFPFAAKNLGSAAWTLVCTTFLCNGASSLLLPPSWSVFSWSNNSTYTVSRFPNFDAFANTGTNAAETFNSTTGAFGALTIGPASSTNGDVASFNGTSGLPLADSGVVAANLTTNSTGGTTNAMPKWSAAHTLTNSTLADDATDVKLTTEPLDLVTLPALVEVANASSTGTTVNKLAKLTGAPSTAVISTAGDAKVEGIVVSGAGTTGSARIATLGTASCVFDGATTAGDYVGISASVNGDCADLGSTEPATTQIIGRVFTTNGGAGTYVVLVYGLDDITSGSGGGGSLTTKTNGGNNTDQTVLNLQNSAATNGLTLTETNTSGGNVQLGYTGTLNNSGLTNSATTVNGQTCTLGSTCTIPQVPQTIQLTSAYTNSTTTPSNVAGGNTIQFTAAANTNYTAECHLYYKAAASGGFQIEWTGPAAPTNVTYGFNVPKSASTFANGVVFTYGTLLGSGITTVATDFDAVASFSLQNGSNTGTVNLLAASTGTGQLTIEKGSYCSIVIN